MGEILADDPDFQKRPDPEYDEQPEPQDYQEYYAEEAQFEKWDRLRNCPVCKEPEGLIYCPNCHRREK